MWLTLQVPYFSPNASQSGRRYDPHRIHLKCQSVFDFSPKVTEEEGGEEDAVALLFSGNAAGSMRGASSSMYLVTRILPARPNSRNFHFHEFLLRTVL
jgi:hypothetical protein